MKNPVPRDEEKANDIILSAKRYYHALGNEMTIFHPCGRKTYSWSFANPEASFEDCDYNRMRPLEVPLRDTPQ